jgi:muconolactone delta-isomerase
MKAVVSMTEEEMEKYRAMYEEVSKKVPKEGWCKNLKRYAKYAHYEFSGDLTDEFVAALGRQPLPDEIIMLVDSGFSHFGARCTFNGKHFEGYVNTD